MHKGSKMHQGNDQDIDIDAAIDMLASTGYRELEEDIKYRIEVLRTQFENVHDNNTLHYIRGQIAGYRNLLGYRNLIEAEYE